MSKHLLKKINHMQRLFVFIFVLLMQKLICQFINLQTKHQHFTNGAA